MPATSEPQRRAAALALAKKHGQAKDVKAGAAVKSMMSMSDADLRDFAKKRQKRRPTA
jgi:hypothetical protein